MNVTRRSVRLGHRPSCVGNADREADVVDDAHGQLDVVGLVAQGAAPRRLEGDEPSGDQQARHEADEDRAAEAEFASIARTR